MTKPHGSLKPAVGFAMTIGWTIAGWTIAGWTIAPEEASATLDNAGISAGLTRGQLDFNNSAAHLLDALLLAKPIVIGNELRKKCIL
jgi:hypothetical protein